MDAVETPTSPSRLLSRLAGAAFVVIVTLLVNLPFLRAVFVFDDEGILLHGAERMLRGERLYGDFFEFLAPGGFFVTAAWLGLVGDSFLHARIINLLIVSSIAVLIYACGLQVRAAPGAAAIVAAFWMLLIQAWSSIYSHHLLTTLFGMTLAYCLLRWLESPRMWLALMAGLAGGSAAMVTQSRGALLLVAGLAAFTDFRRGVRPLIAYCCAAVVPAALALAFLIHQGTLQSAYEAVVLFTLQQYAGIQSVPYGFGYPGSSSNLLLAVLPATAVLTALLIARDWRGALRDRALHLCIGLAVASVLGCLVRPAIFQLSYGLPLAIPLFLLAACRLVKSRAVRIACFSLTMALMVPPVVALGLRIDLVQKLPLVETSRGRIAIAGDNATDKLEMLRAIALLPEGETVFFYPASPLLPFLTKRVHPAWADLFLPYYTTEAQFQRDCHAVAAGAHWVLMDTSQTMEHLRERVYPLMPENRPREMQEFEAMLERGFDPAFTTNSYVLRRRNSTPASRLC